MRDDHRESDVYRASRIILQMAGVKTRQYTPTIERVVLDLRHQGGDHVVVSTTNAINTHNTSTPQSERFDKDVAASVSNNDDDADSREMTRQFHDLLAREANWIPSCSSTPGSSSTKRTDYLSWDDYFMAMAFLTAQRSKDPNTQVGACIVSRDKLILALGYNGFPRGCSDDCLPWSRHAAHGTSPSSQLLHTKYAYVCHAEVNAILNKCSANVKDATLYVALFPCNECAKMIIQAGIEEVVYLQNHYHDTDMCRASRILFGMAGVKLRHYVPTVTTIPIEFGHPSTPPTQ
jgi:dCMP deaminase